MEGAFDFAAFFGLGFGAGVLASYIACQVSRRR